MLLVFCLAQRDKDQTWRREAKAREQYTVVGFNLRLYLG